jgi:hypothetical protein
MTWITYDHEHTSAVYLRCREYNVRLDASTVTHRSAIVSVENLAIFVRDYGFLGAWAVLGLRVGLGLNAPGVHACMCESFCFVLFPVDMRLFIVQRRSTHDISFSFAAA